MRNIRKRTRADATIDAEAGYSLGEMLIVVAITGFLMGSVFTIYQVTQKSTFRASGSEAALVQARAVVDKFGGDFRMVGASRLAYSAPISSATNTSITFMGDIDNTLDASYNPVTVTAAVGASAPSITVSDATNINCGTDITLSDGAVQETHTLPSSGCKAGTTITLGPNNCPYTIPGTSPVQTNAGDRPCTTYPVGAYVFTVETVNWVWDSFSQKLCRRFGGSGTSCGDANGWSDDNDVVADGVTNFSLIYLDRTGACLPATSSATYPPSCAAATLASSDLANVRSVLVTVTVQSQTGDQTVTRKMELTARARTISP